ncbi:hypothetical protein ABHI18_012675 [Aspergillus niger]
MEKKLVYFLDTDVLNRPIQYCQYENLNQPSDIKREQYLDRAAGTLQDGVLQKDIHQVVDLHDYQAHERLKEIARQLHDLLSGHVTFAVRAMDASMIEARTPDSDSFKPSSQLAACPSEASPFQPSIGQQKLPPQGIDTLFIIPFSVSLRALSYNPDCAGGLARMDMWVRCKSIGPVIRELVWCDLEAFFSRKGYVLPRKVIIDEIYARHGKGLSLDAAVEELELVRCRGKLSIYQLSQLLSKAR